MLACERRCLRARRLLIAACGRFGVPGSWGGLEGRAPLAVGAAGTGGGTAAGTGGGAATGALAVGAATAATGTAAGAATAATGMAAGGGAAGGAAGGAGEADGLPLSTSSHVRYLRSLTSGSGARGTAPAARKTWMAWAARSGVG